MINDVTNMRSMMTPAQRIRLVDHLKTLGITVKKQGMSELSRAVSMVLHCKQPTDISQSNAMVVNYYRGLEQDAHPLQTIRFVPLKGYEKRLLDNAKLCEGTR